MTRIEKVALICAIAERLRQEGSWCGETHLQKAIYFAQEVFKIPFGFAFMLYKHGPFSFDLRDELAGIRADNLMELRPNSYPYGPTFLVTDQGRGFSERNKALIDRYRARVETLALEFGAKSVSELEGLATALYVEEVDMPHGREKDRAQRIHTLKPHINLDRASEALRMVAQLRAKAG